MTYALMVFYQVQSTPAPQTCTPSAGAGDVVKTDDPYSSDQDGCACTDSTFTTCNCLVGYGTSVATNPCLSNSCFCLFLFTINYLLPTSTLGDSMLFARYIIISHMFFSYPGKVQKP